MNTLTRAVSYRNWASIHQIWRTWYESLPILCAHVFTTWLNEHFSWFCVSITTLESYHPRVAQRDSIAEQEEKKRTEQVF